MKQLNLSAMLTLSVLLTSGLSMSQTTSDATSHSSKPAANAWMLTPTPYLEWNKDVPPAVRAQRNRLWDEASGRRVPLTGPPVEAGSGPVGEDSDIGFEPLDIVGSVLNRAILTATFTKYRSVLSTSELSIYTEVTLHVDQVFQDRTGSGHPFSNQNITLSLFGGTVALRSGQILSDNTGARELFLEPGHKYLLVLSYEKAGDFYRLADNWDITDGTVRPNDHRTQYLAKEGRSSLNGIAVQQLAPAIDKLLYESK